jgi:NhaP-type Na+/H+ or K+/H+ antiporter
MNIIFSIMLGVLLSPTHGVRAYLDPGTGSFLIQLLIGTVVGAAVLIKAYWARIRSFFSKSDPSEDVDGGADGEPNGDDQRQ